MFSLRRLCAPLAGLAVVPLLLVGCAVPGEETAAAPVAPETSASSPATQPSATSGAGAEVAETGPELAAVPSEAVGAQLDYALAYWSDYNDAEYGTVTGTDCVNFASQTLIARGWSEDAQWYHDEASVWNSSPAWVSSTAMRDYFATRDDVIALDDTQRDQVALGDIVQFDWDNSGDRDHTGVVTRIEYVDGQTRIYFAGHTLDSDYRSVDDAITVDHPGGSVYYWHIPE